jgi:diguanylate cyclase (GGDEF)-like protein
MSSAGQDSTSTTPLADRKTISQHLVATYRPLHRIFMLTAVAYYSYVTFTHFNDESGLHLLILAGTSAITAVAALVIWRIVAALNVSVLRIELLNGLLQFLMLLNVLFYHLLHYEPAKLVYFPLLAVAFAMSSVTLRSLVISVATAIAAMILVILLESPASIGPYFAISVATAVTSIGLSNFLRGVIEREVGARLKTEAAMRDSRRMAEANARLANADFLTALPNRRQFMQSLSTMVAARDGVVVGLIDLDGFKGINDAFGHGAGDRVLIEVARRLTEIMPPEGMVARIGGDEFGLLMPGQHDGVTILTRAERVLDVLRMPFELTSAVAQISGSLGLAEAQPDDTAETVLDRADYAAYEAKHHNNGGMVVFSEQHLADIQQTRQTERALLQADFDTEIVPVFQPIIDARTGLVCGFEALARWTSVELGPISPARFIPIAERLGLVPRITERMVRHALDLVARLPAPLRVSVNLSVHDLASADTMRRLSDILAAAPGGPSRLDFEITETAVMRDIDEANQALLLLLAHGARISLDDFGTGHSSLSRVQKLPLDRIKIDRSFVANIQTDRASQAIVKTTLDLCQNLGISCVVEGAETLEQVSALRKLGAVLFQGYYFSRPLAAEAALASLSVRHVA